MRRALIVIVAVFGSVACVTVRTVPGPDGTTHQLITCPAASGVAACYQKASEICGKYTIVNTSTVVTGTAASTSSDTQLLVKCN